MINAGYSEEEKERLAVDNYKLIHLIANKFRGGYRCYDDLVSAGNLGFAKAINTFDASKGFKFSTYATKCIENEILYFLRQERKHGKNMSLNRELNSNGELDGNMNLEDVIGEENLVRGNIVYTPEEVVIRLEETELVHSAIEKLPARERAIIELRFGLNGEEERTQRDIGKLLNVSQAYISKIEKEIRAKIYNLLADEMLEK